MIKALDYDTTSITIGPQNHIYSLYDNKITKFRKEGEDKEYLKISIELFSDSMKQSHP